MKFLSLKLSLIITLLVGFCYASDEYGDNITGGDAVATNGPTLRNASIFPRKYKLSNYFL